MKKTVVMFVICALIVLALAIWALTSSTAVNIGEIISAGIVIVLVGFAVFFAVRRLSSRRRGEPGEDELSRSVMTRASSLAFYVSIYLWLFVMYISDKTRLEVHSLVGGGIMGMAVVFLLCWLGVRFFGIKNE